MDMVLHGFLELINYPGEVHDTEPPSLFTTSNLAPAEISSSTTAAWPLLAADCSAVQPWRWGAEVDGLENRRAL